MDTSETKNNQQSHSTLFLKKAKCTGSEGRHYNKAQMDDYKISKRIGRTTFHLMHRCVKDFCAGFVLFLPLVKQATPF